MEWRCNNCGGMGGVPANNLNLDEPICIVCSHCSHPTLYAWCEKCGEGMEREEIDLTNQPILWVCETCGNEYQLPPLFYQRPVYFKPSKFSELVYVEKVKYDKHVHVSIDWVRMTLLFWDKHRIKLLLASMTALGLLVVLFFVAKDSLIATFLVLFVFGLFSLVILIDVISLFVSKIFLLIYKIRKRQVS